eukprot:scaffold32302_cov31-Attheya_sp.AAC.1
MSTCQAIHTGTLRWSNSDVPQAFSIFACPYDGAMHNGAAIDQEAQNSFSRRQREKAYLTRTSKKQRRFCCSDD